MDCVLVNDAVATATAHGGKMVECLSAAVAKSLKASEIARHLTDHPDLIVPPKAPLVSSVRHGKPNRGQTTKYYVVLP
mgnify:CR=1 FL=1